MTDSSLPSLDVQKVAAARLHAIDRFPYLASALFAAPVLEAPELGRVMVDEWWRIHADPVSVHQLTVPELAGELLHLTGHLLRDHAARARAVGFDDGAELHHWVDAADAELVDDLPTDLLSSDAVRPDALGCEDGRLAEEYYRRGLPRQGMENNCGSGSHGRHAPWEPPPPSPGGEGLEKDQQDLVRRRVADDVLRHGGEATEGLRRWAQEAVGSQVDWRRELASELRRSISWVSGAVDYSWARPSRRAAALGPVVLPSLRRPVPEVAVVADTSASVSDELLGEAMAEVDGLLSAVGVRDVRLLACDDAVRGVSRTRHVDDITLLGGGGTDMEIGLHAALDHRPRPQVVVVLTDGWSPWPQHPPPATRVVVGLLGADPSPPPPWCRSVRIGGDR
ncbi:MAG: hypothetical protein GY929_00020 [Actinomycetia bacterium]|nr:hypothetical protein [Actinomycetes bacterium]